MVAPCVERLELSIQTAGTDIERAMLSAELGCYLARIGSSESAEKIRLTLRQEFGDGRDGGLVVPQLDQGYEVALHAGLQAKLLLAEAGSKPKSAKCRAERQLEEARRGSHHMG